MSRTIQCSKLEKQAEGMDFSPYPGDLGQRIFENISKEAWLMWMNHQTMLINEKQLSMIDPEARTYLAGEMEKFLFGGDLDKIEGYVPE
ncbi:MAG: oxidative damage protection protein [Gammaproteobacteria bacterium]|nr:MAG: oxidative damage protection protein [Gammaproteobacteria bacterium]